MFLEYIIILFCSYLLLSLIIAIIGSYGYREILTHPVQVTGFMLVYWWIPLFRIFDIQTKNSQI